MNLIDQFGYDAVKGAGINYRNSGDPVTAEKFEVACLEHRKNHNIYEKGDWIVNTKTGAFGDFIKFADTKNGHKHCLVDIGLSDTALFCIKSIRHATDLEIAAGHRL